MVILSILEDFLGDIRKHNESKSQVAFDCPACSLDKGKVNGDGKGNLEINYEKGVFKCWACHQYNNMSGTINKLIRAYGNESHLKKFHLYKPEFKSEIKKEPDKEILTLPKGFTKLIYPNKYDTDYQEAMGYLVSRNIGLSLIIKYDLGYTKEKGKFYGRIIMPSYDKNNQLNYIVGRAFKKNVWPKYYNPDLDKKNIIFNENKINWDSTIYLVEGPFDHLVVPNSIPLLGKYISDLLLMTLLENATADIVILLDDDAKFDIDYLYKRLNIAKLFGRVKVIYLPKGYDIAKIHKKLGKKGVCKALRNAKIIKESQNYIRYNLKLS